MAQPDSRTATRSSLPTKNIENNPMQSSGALAWMLERSRENILTRRANQGHYSIVAQCVERLWPCPTGLRRLHHQILDVAVAILERTVIGAIVLMLCHQVPFLNHTRHNGGRLLVSREEHFQRQFGQRHVVGGTEHGHSVQERGDPKTSGDP